MDPVIVPSWLLWPEAALLQDAASRPARASVAMRSTGLVEVGVDRTEFGDVRDTIHQPPIGDLPGRGVYDECKDFPPRKGSSIDAALQGQMDDVMSLGFEHEEQETDKRRSVGEFRR